MRAKNIWEWLREHRASEVAAEEGNEEEGEMLGP